jgi:hypothetical protein
VVFEKEYIMRCSSAEWIAGNCGTPWVNCAVLCVKDDWKGQFWGLHYCPSKLRSLLIFSFRYNVTVKSLSLTERVYNIIYLLTANGLIPGGSGYFTCIQNVTLYTECDIVYRMWHRYTECDNIAPLRRTFYILEVNHNNNSKSAIFGLRYNCIQLVTCIYNVC